MIDIVCQIAIILTAPTAVWFVGREEEWGKYGYLIGFLSQPFWFYTTIANEQWGMIVVCCLFTYSWGQGLWNKFLKRKNPILEFIKRK